MLSINIEHVRSCIVFSSSIIFELDCFNYFYSSSFILISYLFFLFGFQSISIFLTYFIFSSNFLISSYNYLFYFNIFYYFYIFYLIYLVLCYIFCSSSLILLWNSSFYMRSRLDKSQYKKSLYLMMISQCMSLPILTTKNYSLISA